VVAGKKDHRRIWETFAARGMGAGASAADGKDPTPVAAFDLPPGLPASDRLGPAVTIDSPADLGVVRVEGARFAGTAADDAGVVSLLVNGAPVSAPQNGTWQTTLKLPAGRRQVQVVARDIEDRTAVATRTVLVDARRPKLGKVKVRVRGKRLLVTGVAKDDVGAATVRLGRKTVRAGRGGKFFAALKRSGPKRVRVVIKDRAGRTSRKKSIRLR
jgi:hypothetical protein